MLSEESNVGLLLLYQIFVSFLPFNIVDSGEIERRFEYFVRAAGYLRAILGVVRRIARVIVRPFVVYEYIKFRK
jgi:hypothetical protein